MTRRTVEHRRRHRRILGWSLGAALLIHVGTLVLVTWRDEGGQTILGRGPSSVGTGATGTVVELVFGAPSINMGGGLGSRQVVHRTLEARRALSLPVACGADPRNPSRPARLRLILDNQGRVLTLSLVGSTGDACWDAVAMKVVPNLHYQWLPNERFPHPVDLIQPIWMALASP